MFVPCGGRLYQYSAGIASKTVSFTDETRVEFHIPDSRQSMWRRHGQLPVVGAGSVFAWLEPLTLKLTQGEVEGLDLSPETVSWLVAFIEAGRLISPPVSGILANRFGWKVVILSVSPLCLVGWLMLIFSTSIPILYIVRFLQGLVVGLTLTIPLIYTAEISEYKIRGRISGILQVAWYLGMLYSFIVGHHFNYRNYVIACIPIPLIFTAAFAIFPESPYYLLKSWKTHDAEGLIKASTVTAAATKVGKATRKTFASEIVSSWGARFFDHFERRAFIILQIGSITKFLTGLPTADNYTTKIFSMASGLLTPEELTIILGCLLCGTTVLSALLSGLIGPRCLLLFSCFGMFVSHLLTGTYFFLEERTSIDASPFVFLMYVGLSSYFIFSRIGVGPLLQTLQADRISVKTQGLAGGLMEAFTSIFSFTVLKAYRPINEYSEICLNLWLYCGVGLICGILLAFLMFEPNGNSIRRYNTWKKYSTTKLYL